MIDVVAVGYSRNPVTGLRPVDMRPAPVGVPIQDLPKILGFEVERGPRVCRVNGQWLLRKDWKSRTRPGDVVEFHDHAQDRDTLRGVITIIAIYYLGPAGANLTGAAYAAAVVGTTIAINALIPPTPLQSQGTNAPPDTGRPLGTALGGNEARLDQPIWKICGHREINPPYAGQAYFEFLPNPESPDEELDRDQYFYALYSIGVGEYDVYAKIGNTPISRFQDVIVAQYLPPGTQPSFVEGNVTTSREVSSLTMDSGRYVGGFAACAPQRRVAEIGIDVMAPRGLGKTGGLTVEWQIEFREIDDFGALISDWTILATETRTAFTSTPQRWSNRYTVPTSDPQRIEVRLIRIDEKDTDPAALHELAWTGLRGYLAEPASLDPDTAHFELVLRASSQLSGDAARDLRLVVDAKTRVRDSDGWSVDTVVTRNPAWWMAELCTDPVWGMGLPDDRVDLATLEELAALYEVRQDHFDFVFDQSVDSWDALQLIARAGRCRAFRRNGVITFARDGLADLPVTAFTPDNCIPGSMVVRETLRTRDSPDGVIVEYQDHRSWEWVRITCPLPGLEESDVQNPIVLRLPGVIGSKQAEREGRYEAANLLYRPRTVGLKTELEGMLPAYLSPVRFQADIAGYGQSGEVVDWDSGTLEMELSEAPNLVGGTVGLVLVRDDGSLTDPVVVTAGSTAWHVLLPSLPDFTPSFEDPDRERTRYMLALQSGAGHDIVKVTSIRDGGTSETEDGSKGAQLYEIAGVIDDDRVHTVDLDLLPETDEIQDPIGTPDDDVGGGFLYVPQLFTRTVHALRLLGVGDPDVDMIATYRLDEFGSLTYSTSTGAGSSSTTPANEWMKYGPVDPSIAALFQVRATLLSESSTLNDETFTGTLNTYEDFPVQWELTLPGGTTGRQATRVLLIEIKDTYTGIVKESKIITLKSESEGIP